MRENDPLAQITDPDDLRALVRSGVLLASELNLAGVLQNILDKARELVQAKYAALGVVQAGSLTEFMTSGMDQETREKIGPLPTGKGLLGVLVRDPRPMRIANVTDDPRSIGFPPNHPMMSNFMGLPISVHDEISGRLYLTDKIDADEFTERDEAVATVLARQAGIAILNARLYESEKTRLEASADLKEARTRERLHKELVTRTMEAQEEERRRIARELHDEAGQALTSVMLGLGLLRETDDHSTMNDQIELVRNQVSNALARLRSLAAEMRPSALDGLGLVAAVRHLVEDPALMEGVQIDFAASDLQGQLQPEAEAVIYRILQEALTNVARHSEAENVSVTIGGRDNKIVAVVEDDGKGFNKDETKGLGLVGMRERIDLVDGELQIESSPSHGTTVVCEVPVGRDGGDSG